MYALIKRDYRQAVSLQLTQDSESDARWYRDRYTFTFPWCEWIVVPFLSYVDQKRSSGANPYPVRQDFDFDAWKAKQKAMT